MKQTSYQGFNLTRATLDGLLKHKKDGAVLAMPVCYASEQELVSWITQGVAQTELALEAQIVDWADQVAYSVHDLEDGIHAGMITSAKLNDPRIAKSVIAEVAKKYSQAGIDQTYHMADDTGA